MGFKMRSGNGPLAFKNMGSSPAKQSMFGPSKLDLKSANADDSTISKVSKKVTGEKTPKLEPKKIKIADAKFDASKITVTGSKDKGKIKTRGKNQNASKIGDTAERSELDVAKSDGRASRKKEKHQKKLDRANETLEERSARKKVNREKFSDAVGELSDRVDPDQRGLYAKSKANNQTLTEKATARKDKDIQNANTIANTKRTNQLTSKATTEVDSENSKLDASDASTNPDSESSAEKIANKKAQNEADSKYYGSDDDKLKNSKANAKPKEETE